MNPAYAGMGLFGSEYWTFFFVNRLKSKGWSENEISDHMKKGAAPIGWREATDLGMIDFCKWNSAEEQEKYLPSFFEENRFQMISKGSQF